MELDNTPGVLHVATGDHEVVKEALAEFNSAYKKSKLRYLSSEEIDGVPFSYIDASNATLDHIFLFGAAFGDKVKRLRDAKKINW